MPGYVDFEQPADGMLETEKRGYLIMHRSKTKTTVKRPLRLAQAYF
jgi:hypothetical protein